MGTDVLRGLVFQQDKKSLDALEEKAQQMGGSLNSGMKYYMKKDMWYKIILKNDAERGIHGCDILEWFHKWKIT